MKPHGKRAEQENVPSETQRVVMENSPHKDIKKGPCCPCAQNTSLTLLRTEGYVFPSWLELKVRCLLHQWRHYTFSQWKNSNLVFWGAEWIFLSLRSPSLSPSTQVSANVRSSSVHFHLLVQWRVEYVFLAPQKQRIFEKPYNLAKGAPCMEVATYIKWKMISKESQNWVLKLSLSPQH